LNAVIGNALVLELVLEPAQRPKVERGRHKREERGRDAEV
jgi:hypothetical protein